MKRSGSHCRTYFRIAGDFDPAEITEMLGLQPEAARKKGDKRPNGTVYGFSVWKFGSCCEYDIETTVQMEKTIEPLLPKTEILKEIARLYGASFTLEAVPVICTADESLPCLAPSLKVMRFCCETGTELDIDLYLTDK